MQSNFQSIFKYTSYAVVAAMSYYMFISFQIYQITHAMAPDHGITDLPNFKEIFWIPIVSAFALFAFKRQLENMSTPIFLLICKD